MNEKLKMGGHNGCWPSSEGQFAKKHVAIRAGQAVVRVQARQRRHAVPGDQDAINILQLYSDQHNFCRKAFCLFIKGPVSYEL